MNKVHFYTSKNLNFLAGKSDWEYINLSQDHEIDYILSQYGWKKDENNREILRKWALEAKLKLGRTSTQNITHGEFYEFILNVKKHKRIR